MKPKRLMGDTNYGTADILAWLVNEKKIAPHVPVWDKSDRTEAHYLALTLCGMQKLTNTAARKVRHYARIGGLTKRLVRILLKTISYVTAQGNQTARPVQRKINVAQTH